MFDIFSLQIALQMEALILEGTDAGYPEHSLQQYQPVLVYLLSVWKAGFGRTLAFLLGSEKQQESGGI